MEIAPVDIQQRKSEMILTDLAYSMNKSNNSYDTPTSIEDYNVDQFNVETLNKVYQFEYTAAGKLLRTIRLDATMTNERRTTYNYTESGELSSMIYEQWNGFGWDLDYRYIRTYTVAGFIEYSYYEVYNGSDWELNYVEHFQYTGDLTTPSLITAAVSEDNIQWQDEVKIFYTYGAGTTPETVEIIVFDDNYLYWSPAEKWEVSNWGPMAFQPDRLFNAHEGLNKVTDNLIYKFSGFDMYPSDFIYYNGYDYAAGEYIYKAKIASTYNQNDRTKFYINEYNGASYDSTSYYALNYHNCYGYKGNIGYDYVSPGVWSIDGGSDFQGTTTPYASSCYVTAYDYFSNFTDIQPTGARSKRWVINQASALGLEEALNSSYTLYPNPVDDELTIDLGGMEYNQGEYFILSYDGKMLNSAQLSSGTQKVDVNTLPEGTYFLNVSIDGQSTVKKFIKL
jgi:hypothetical protein